MILACTHYTVLKGTIRKIKPNLGILDISELFADHFARSFKVLGSGGEIKVFLTGKEEKYPKLISALKFPCPIELV